MNKEEISEKLFRDDKDVAIGFIQHELRTGTELEHLEDIFIDSMAVLYDKYLIREGVDDYIRARKILYGVIKIHIKKFKRRMADEAFMNTATINLHGQDSFMSAEKSDIQLRPPSYYYARDYRKRPEVYERWLEWSRAYYWKNHDKMLAREQDPRRKAKRLEISKAHYWKIKADPSKHTEFLKKRRAWRNEYRRLKREGLWVDRRFFANKTAPPKVSNVGDEL